MWFDEVKKAATSPDKIYADIAAENLPVTIYGAGLSAKEATEALKNHNIEVTNYAVDDEYYKPNLTYLGKPIINVNDLFNISGGGVCVLGMESHLYFDLNEKIFSRVKKIMSNKNIRFYNILPHLCDAHIEVLDLNYIDKNSAAFNETYELLADEKSKSIFTAWLQARVGYDNGFIFDMYDKAQYFNELTKKFLNRYLDCGACIGDTVEEFVKFTGGNYEKIYAIEPIPSNLKKLTECVKLNNYKNVHIIDKATSDYKGKAIFSDNFSGSHITDETSGNVSVDLDTIDNILQGDEVTLIKMDLEGSELKSLKGASKTIEKYMPCLAICAYHKAHDLIALPKFIKQFKSDNKHYEFYLRFHGVASVYELVLYAIPVEE